MTRRPRSGERRCLLRQNIPAVGVAYMNVNQRRRTNEPVGIETNVQLLFFLMFFHTILLIATDTPLLPLRLNIVIAITTHYDCHSIFSLLRHIYYYFTLLIIIILHITLHIDYFFSYYCYIHISLH